MSPQEHAQHLLRMEWTWGPHGDRLVWALVNGVLVRQASGKGFLVHRIMMRRLGWRVAGQEVLTKGELRNLTSDESAARSLVGQLGTCGRDVPSTPMHWSFEGKKLDAAVKHLSWCPPWVRSEATKEVPPGFIPEEHRVDDVIGLGRIPTAWWTLNCKYNDAYDIHRFNVRAALRRQAVDPHDVNAHDVRFDFVRTAPDLATMMVALRTELSMRIVMPSVIPSTATSPYLTMARFETGASGNPHWHGFSVGAGGPRLLRVRADLGDDTAGDEAPGSECGDEDVLRCEAADADSESAGDDAECRGIGSARLSRHLPRLPPLSLGLRGAGRRGWWPVAAQSRVCPTRCTSATQECSRSRRWSGSFLVTLARSCPSGTRATTTMVTGGFSGMRTWARTMSK